MAQDWMSVVGGIGFFLLGMNLMTQGLRSLAGEALRRILARFTRSPATGALSGAVTTALIQSSSATTVVTVSFVTAGLLTFPQALGVVFGANAGTTITGWMVAILGFKLNIGTFVSPLILAGVILHLFSRSRIGHLGWAFAGFGLLFVGIDGLQAGMSSFRGVVTPEHFPPDTTFGRIQMIGLGILITLITQSSSAGVTAALAALGAGAISFPQAAAMVIGMDIGTTFTAALATVGGTASSRRTGFAHVIYNLLTAVMAFFLLDLFTWTLDQFSARGPGDNPQISLVLFHTIFNVVGVLAALPLAQPFATLLVFLFPDRGPEFATRLESTLQRDPAAASYAALATSRELSTATFVLLSRSLEDENPSLESQAAPIRNAVRNLRDFAGKISVDRQVPSIQKRIVEVYHLTDHLDRLLERVTAIERVRSSFHDPRLRRLSRVLRGTLDRAVAGEGTEESGTGAMTFDRVRRLFRKQRRVYRRRLLLNATRHPLDPEEILDRLDSVRWHHRVAYHVWRLLVHLDAERLGTPVESSHGHLDDEP